MGGATLTKGKTLKRAFTRTIILSSSIPLILVALVLSYLISWNLSRNMERNIRFMTTTISRQIDQFFSVPTIILNQLKAILEAQDSLAASNTLDRYLTSTRENFPYFNRLILLNDQGMVSHISPYDPDYLGNDLSHHPVFRAPEDRVDWSPVYISSVTGKPTVSASITVKEGVLVGYLDLDYLISLISEIEIDHKGFIIITDFTGTILVHPDQSLGDQQVNISQLPLVEKGLQGVYGQGTSRYQGIDYLSTVTPVGRFDWLLLIYREKREVYRLNSLVGFVSLGSIILILAVSALLSFLVTRRALGSLEHLNRLTHNVSMGRYGEFRWDRSYGELDSLALNFSQMITAVKGREKEILSLRKRLANHINSMPSLTVGIDGDYTVDLWNDKIEELSGLTAQEARGRSLFSLLPSLLPFEPLIRRCLEEGRGGERSRERGLYGEADSYWDLIVYPLETESGRGAGLRLDNVTELVNTEMMMHQSEKLNSLGKLSAGISHDLNNMLTPIIGYGELLKPLLEGNGEGRAYTEQIIEAADRAQKLVRQLLVFSKKQSLEYKIVDLNKLLTDFHKLLYHSLPETVSITYWLKEGVSPVRADEGQLEQVILNLAINARDAMPDGGRLTIATEEIYLEEPLESHWDWSGPRAFICLTVADTGRGMDPEVLNRVFEPFFSTKGSKGSGLGLSMVYGIVEQHGGHIRIESRAGEGSCFFLYLPSAEGKISNEPALSPGKAARTFHGTVLLVEDDEPVRNMAAAFFRKKGFRVVTTVNGEEGLERYRRSPGEFALVLSDIIMPVMNGKAMVKAIRELNGDQRVIFMSGYTDNLISDGDRKDPLTRFLNKPFKMEALTEAVQSLLS